MPDGKAEGGVFAVDSLRHEMAEGFGCNRVCWLLMWEEECSKQQDAGGDRDKGWTKFGHRRCPFLGEGGWGEALG